MQRLQGKVAFVAGGATGIGAGCAQRLATEGAQVVLGDINLDAARATVDRITAESGQALAVHFNLMDETSCQHLIATAIETFGGVDYLHNNGADTSDQTIRRNGDLLSMEFGVWKRAFHTNLYGFAYTCRAVIPHFLQRGGGTIVNTSFDAGNIGEATRVAYACSKAGINALTRHITSRWGKDNIRCNAIAPRPVLHDKLEATLSDEFRAQMYAMVRSARLGRPVDIGAMVAHLFSEDGSWINGQVIHINGGAVLRD